MKMWELGPSLQHGFPFTSGIKDTGQPTLYPPSTTKKLVGGEIASLPQLGET